jgi:hypothetical protein
VPESQSRSLRQRAASRSHRDLGDLKLPVFEVNLETPGGGRSEAQTSWGAWRDITRIVITVQVNFVRHIRTDE